MGRKIYIIPKKAKVETSDKTDALLAGCTEIVNGIPPLLVGVVNENSLPITFEEPDQPAPEPIIDL